MWRRESIPRSQALLGVVVVKDVPGNNGYLRGVVGETVTLSFENCDTSGTEEIIKRYRRDGAAVVDEGWVQLSDCAVPVDVTDQFATVVS